MKVSKLLGLVLSAVALVLSVVSIVLIKKHGLDLHYDGFDYAPSSYPYLSWAIYGLLLSVVLAVAMLLSGKFKYMMMVPMLLSYVFLYAAVKEINNQEVTKYTEYEILGLSLLVAFVVSLVFAAKGKKWAGIVVIVCLCVQLYYFANVMFYLFNLKDADESWKTVGYYINGAITLSIAALAVLGAEIAYYTKDLCELAVGGKKKEAAPQEVNAEEVKEEVKTEEAVPQEVKVEEVKEEVKTEEAAPQEVKAEEVKEEE